nr:hypothetical protein [Tanacetum cinerariifolium]
MASSLIPQMEYAPTVYQQSEFSSPDTRLVVPVFKKGNDPIDAINHMMSFLTSVVTSRYPSTNNQLRTSSNPRQQATINNGRVTIQLIQWRQNSLTTGSSRPYASGSGGLSGKQRVIVCYNCKGEGHMSKQCTMPKRKRDTEWFKDKALLVQALANRQVLQEEELEFLADPGIAETSTTKAIQADCDVKATNIILQGLPPEVYALVSTHKSYHQHQFQSQASTYQSSPYTTQYHPPRYASQSPSSSSLSISYPPIDIQSSVNHNIYMASSSIPQMEYAPTVYQQSEFSSPDTRLVVPVFKKGDDPIDAINHMMSFLTSVVTSRVTIQPIQWRQNSLTTGSSRPYASGSGGLLGKQRDKALLVQALANGQVLQEEELEFLADTGIAETSKVQNQDNVYNNVLYQDVQKTSTSEQSNILNQSKTEITSDSNIISYSQYLKESQYTIIQNSSSPTLQDDLILSVIEQLKTQVVNCTKINQDNKNVNEILTAELERYKNQERILKKQNNDDKASASYEQSLEIKTLKHTLSGHLELALEKQALGFQNLCYLKRAQQLKPKLYDGSLIEKSDAIVIYDSDETLLLSEESRSKMIEKQNDPKMAEKKVITKPIDYVVLNQLLKDFETSFVP